MKRSRLSPYYQKNVASYLALKLKLALAFLVLSVIIGAYILVRQAF